MSAFALSGCGTKITKLGGFSSAVGFATLTTSASTYNFGNITRNVLSSSYTITFTNTVISGKGAGTLTCTTPTLTNGLDFQIGASNCGTLAQEASCTVPATTQPTARGLLESDLSLTCTDVLGKSQTILSRLRVTGVEIVLAVTPMTYDFGNVNVGANTAATDFTFSNTGNISATGCSAPTITDTTHFTIVAGTCGTNDLVVNGSCTASIRANPASSGAHAATLSRTCTTGGTVSTTTNQIVTNGILPNIAWTPLTYGFGNIPVGSNSTSQTFTLSNTGGAAATGCSLATISDTTNFSIVGDTCGTLDLAASGGTCTVVVRGNPTTAGTKTATLSRTCTFGGTASTTANQITVTGTSASLAWTPLTNAFGNVNVGSNSATQTFTLTNAGGATATGCSAPSITDTTNFTITTDNCGASDLAGGSATCTVLVRANPTTAGAKATTLSRTCTFGGTASTTANQITATGVQPSLDWTPLTYAFGNVNVGSNSSSQVFTLTNSGAAAATGCSAPTISDTTNFTITSDLCSTGNLGASSLCTISVQANPTTAGAKSATVSRTCTFGGTATTTTNQITATGVEPSLAWAPLTYDFANINVGSNSSTQTFTLTNSGAATATGCSAPSITDTVNFTIATDNCSTTNLAGSGATCTVLVLGNPTTAGVKTTTLSRTCTFGGTASTTASQIIVTGIQPSLAWTPLTFDFGNVNVGSNSATQTFTLTNAGTATATGCSAPSITDTTNFTITTDNCGTSTLAGGSATCTVLVRGNPTTSGAKTTTLSRTCTFGGTASTTANQIIVTGTTANLAWTPLTNDFGNINVGSNSATQTFTLTNAGTASATGCSAPSITDTTNFTITTDNCGTADLAGGSATCTVLIRGNPTTTGAKTTTLSRTCTFGGTPSTTANQIIATGVSASLAWTPLTNDFGNVNVGANSSTQTFTLTNSGGSSATGCSAPSITDTTSFTITTDNCGVANLAGSGATCTVLIRANPATAGAKATTLSRTCTFGGTASTTSNQIIATGIQPTLDWTPLTFAFGNVNVGSNSSSQVFTLTNSGAAAATGCSAPTISDTTNFTITSDLCSTGNLGASSLCTISVQANPTTAGAKTATLSRTCTFGGTATTTANQITTTGITANLAWTPLTNDFGNVNVGSNSSTQTFTLTNSGAATATGCAAPTITDATHFTITTDNCSTNNLAGASATCTVLVRGNPTTAGAKSTTLSRTCTFGGTATTTTNQIIVTGIQPVLAWSPLTYDFGNVSIGSNSATQTFTLTNSGTATATGCSAPTMSDVTNFTITTDNCGTNTLAGASATCTVIVRGNPTSTGAKTATLSRTCTFGGTASTTANQITVTGTSASLAWSPLTNDFGDVDVGANSATQTFTMTNSGGAAATGCFAPTITDTTNFTITTDNCGAADLAGSGGTCTVLIRGNPTTLGAKATTLSRTCTFGGTIATNTNGIVMVGRQVNLAFDILTNNFGNVNVGANSANQVFILENFGNKTATGCAGPALSNATDFQIVSETCGTANVLAAGTCTVTVRATPQSAGAKSTTLSRTCTVGGTPATTANGLTTNAVQPSLAWSPMTNNFGNVNVGANSATQIFTLTNSGTATATGCSAPSIADTTNFTVTADTCGTADLAGASATCTVTIRGNPTSAGAKATTLSRVCSFGGTASTTSNQIIVTGIQPSLAWTPLTNDFGNVNVGANSATQTFTLTNAGTATATGCSAPTVTDTTNFTITTDNCGAANLAGSSATCTVLIRGNPASAGAKSTTLSRTCTFGGTASTTASQIIVTGIQPTLDWTPLTFAFGNVNVGSNSSSQVFTLTNSGAAAATGCSAPTISDSTNFTITSDVCGTANLGASSLCTISVQANPTTAGAKTATVSRTCTFGGTATTTANQITTTGITANLAWTPLTNDFGNINVGANSSTQTFTLTNSGAATATGCSAPTITDTTNFTITTDNCGAANLAGSSATCTVLIRGNPTTAGAKSTTLSRTCTFGGTASTTANQIIVTGIQPVLAWSPLTNDFGAVNVGSNSGTQTFTLTNSGTATATGCSTPTIGDVTNFTITTDNCGTSTLAGGSTTCTVLIRGNPTTTGAKATTLSRTCTFGGTAATTTNQIIVTGASASLAWTPLTNDFGNVNVGSNSGTQTFTLTNAGGSTATGCSAPSIADTTNFTITTDNCSTNNLAGASATCTVLIRGNPTSAGAKATTLSRTCTFGGTAATTSNQIIVTGIAPILAWSPLTNNFGNVNVGANSATQTFTLTNSGTATATGCSAPSITDTTNFTITTDNCGTANLAGASATCTVLVRGNPTTTGAKTTTLSRTCTFGGAAATTTNQIIVTGIAPSLAWTPLTNDFGNINVGSNSSTQTFTLTNAGGATATGCSAPTITDTTNFTITTDNCSTNNLAGASATCTVLVRGNPTTTGAKTTTLSRTCTFGGTASTTASQIIVTGVAPSLAWTPLTNAFGSVNVGANSGTQTFTLTNSGTATATGCSAPTIGDVTNFTITTDNCGVANLAGASATCTVLIRGNPTTTGLLSTTLSRTCTFGGAAATTTNQITVTGIAPSLAWTPLTNDFGNINVGSNSGTQTFTLTNSGTATATGCSAPTIADVTNFTITTDNCGVATLAGGSATCTVLVRGNPTTAGAKATTLSRTCTFGGTAATTSNQIIVTGIAPSLAWSPLTNAFGNVNVGSNSGTQTFTLTNSGTATATGCAAPSLSDATNFSITTDNCGVANLAGASATCTVLVRANPTTAGAKTATLSRTCTFGGTASTTANLITATGIAPSLAWTPLTNDFGNINVGANSGTQTFTLTNSGTATATGCSAPSITDTTNFTITTDNCGTANLAGASATCTVLIRGNPTTTGAKSTTLSRTCTFGGTPSTTTNQIIVTGVQPVLAWSPLTNDFGSVNLGSNSGTQTFTLTNSGGSTATGCSAPSITDTTHFTIATDNCGTATLAGGSATCTVLIRANPTTNGVKTTTLSRTCTWGGTASTTANQIVTTGVSASLAWTPLTKDFGNVNVGSNSATQTFTLTNAGTATATGCSAPSITDTTNFTITTDNCGTATLAGGSATCTVLVRANPTSSGAKATTLSRTCTFGGTASTTSNQIITMGLYPSLAWNPLTTGFGNVAYTYGKSGSITFTITNSGNGDATGCSAPTLTGANPTEFEISIDNCGTSNVTASGGSCTVNVRTNLTGTGVKTATLSRACTFGGTTTTTANQITATGVAISANLVMNAEIYPGDPAGYFGMANVNKYTATKDITIGNTGTTTISGCGAPTIADTTHFSLVSHNCGATIASGAHCTAKVRGRPTSSGGKTTTVSMTCTGGTASLTLSVEGNSAPTLTRMLVGNPSLYLMSDGQTRYSEWGNVYPIGTSAVGTPTMIAAGYGYICGLQSGGTIKCYGGNSDGRLGDGTTTDAWGSPVTVSGITTAISVSTHSSGTHTCAVITGGTVKCWGDNSYGQLGDGTTTNRATPVTVSGITTATEVALGINHTCARLADGTMQCWGNNEYGKLGDGTTTQRLTPVTVQISAGTNLTNVATMALGDFNNTCAIITGGTARCWGEGGYGKNGDGNGSTQYYAATQVSGITNATQLALGYTAVCAVLADGTGKCWGANGMGELGDGTTTNSLVPVTVAGLTSGSSISGVWQAFCAVRTDGSAKCWGTHHGGATGSGKAGVYTIATQKTAITNATQISVGEVPCVRISDGTVKCWSAWATRAQSGHDDVVNATTPIAMSGITTATQVAGSLYTTCILLSSGSIKCIGANTYGSLGDGTTNDTYTPPVTVLGITTATQITGGREHFCARLSDGTVKCWGWNSNYQLGDGTQIDRSTPVTVAGLSGVTAVYTGKDQHTCAVLSSGDVKCWGYNANGQLGDGTTTTRSTPTLVPGLHNVSTLAVGASHTCALLTDGTARCWGANDYSQLGDGTTTESHSPVNASWYSNFTSLSAGPRHTCGVLSDGKARCWGYGLFGEMGAGNRETGVNISQTSVFSLTNTTQIASGWDGWDQDFNCAIDSAGAVRCWGGDRIGFPDLTLRDVSGFIP